MTTYSWTPGSNLTLNISPWDTVYIHGTTAAAVKYSALTDMLTFEVNGSTLTLASPGINRTSVNQMYLTFDDGSKLVWVSDSDHYTGGNGADQIISSSTSGSWLNGGAGNDLIFGGTGGTNFLYGDDGDDTLVGSTTAFNVLVGGTGNDHYIIRNYYDYVLDSDGKGDGLINVNFYKPSYTISNWTWAKGVMKLPYWIDSLTHGDASGLSPLLNYSTGGTVSYNFAQAPSAIFGADDKAGFKPFNADQMAYARKVMAYISSIFNVQFVESSTPDSPFTVVFGNSDLDSATAAYSHEINISSGSTLMLGNGGSSDPVAHPALDGGKAITALLLHELGHSLGLKHPFATNSIDGHAELGPSLPTSEDNNTFTLMSYTRSGADLTKYAPLDIASLSYIWGFASGYKAGDDTYLLSTGSANLIADPGGNNTIDGSHLTSDMALYLEPGYWGYIGSKASTITAPGQITVDFGSKIRTAIGGSGSDLIVGTSADNMLYGGAGDDGLAPQGGNDLLDGGSGKDTALMTGKRSDYTLGHDASGHVTLTRGSAIDTLVNMERIQFSDSSLALDTEGIAGDIYRLYQAAFNRKPDQAGLGFWLYYGEKGMSLKSIASGFMQSAEFAGLFGGASPDPTVLIPKMYDNVLHRPYDQGGYDFWLGLMQKGMSGAEVLCWFADSPENHAQVVGSMQNGLAYAPYFG